MHALSSYVFSYFLKNTSRFQVNTLSNVTCILNVNQFQIMKHILNVEYSAHL